MTAPSGSGPSQTEREREYYKREYDQLGARLLRLQEEHGQVAREARRSRIVARLVRAAYQLIDADVDSDTVGPRLLSVIADTAMCDGAALLRLDPAAPGVFALHAALGPTSGTALRLADPPEFLFTARGLAAPPAAGAIVALLDMPYVLWGFDAQEGHALVLGNRSQSNVHRPFEADDRELVGVALAVYKDVLTRKRIERDLRDAKQAAETANAMRARFLETVSQEFRSPLEAVIGFSELLGQTGRTGPNERQRIDYAGQIFDSGQRLLALVRDILQFSRFDSAVPELQLDWVPLDKLLHNAAEAVAGRLAGRGLRLSLALPETRWLIRVDYEGFRQILGHLIGNAIKFSADGGEIELAAGIDDDGTTTIRVRDTGIGIPQGDVGRVFEPFVQLHSGAGRRAAGAGLGLPIARQLVEAHRGTIALSSVEGRGTTVTITLPPEAAMPAADPPPAPHSD